jgi:hypothetical protein
MMTANYFHSTLALSAQHLCPYQAVEQCPRQHKPTQPLKQAPSPKLHAAPKVSVHARVPLGLGFLNNPRSNSECIYERGRDQREDQVEDEAWIGFETQNSGSNTEEGSG